jgi:autoinducer 2-degrading protein
MNSLSDRAAFVVTVAFRLKAGAEEAFSALIRENARSSLEDEPGCRQFDVVIPTGQPDTVFLYEVYDSPDAFEAHKATSHFQSFDRDSAPYVADKTVMTGTRLFPARGDE